MFLFLCNDMCNVFISMQWHVKCFYFYAMTCAMFLFLCNDMWNVFISMQWHVQCFYFYAMTCEMFLFLCNDMWNVFISMQWHVKCFYFYAMTYEMFLFLCNDMWNVFRVEAAPSRAKTTTKNKKKQKSIGKKSFYSNKSYGFLCLLNASEF